MPPVMTTEHPLLAPPGTDSASSSISRVEHDFQDLSDRFRLSTSQRDYHKQFSPLYTRRLQAMLPKLTKLARDKWGHDVPVMKLYQIQNAGRCILVGTLHRRMSMRPSMLAEVGADYHLQPPPPPRKRFAADEADVLSIEDEVQRIPLAGKLDVKDFVTGVTIAVVGAEASDESGRFIAEDYLTLGQSSLSQPGGVAPAEDSRPSSGAAADDDDQSLPNVLLVSGLNFGSKNPDNLFPLSLLGDMINGDLGDASFQNKSSKIARVIVAGNSISKETQENDWATGPKFRQKRTNQESFDAVNQVDAFLQPLTSSVHVDLLPGESDPASFLWPQQPLHSCLFPLSSQSSGFHSMPNPYMASVSGKLILGTSGQNVANIIKCSTLDNPLAVLRKTLSWRHLAPTAPDTLGCYPFLDKDPFIMETVPDVYFAGNCDRFEQCWVPSPSGEAGEAGEGTLVVTVPDFSKTRTAVLVNLQTMNCTPVVCQDLEMEEGVDK